MDVKQFPTISRYPVLSEVLDIMGNLNARLADRIRALERRLDAVEKAATFVTRAAEINLETEQMLNRRKAELDDLTRKIDKIERTSVCDQARPQAHAGAVIRP